jgi:hypothetical protein
MTCDRFRERMIDLLEGGLTGSEAREWEAHRMLCPACQTLWEAARMADAWLRAAPPAPPPPDLSLRVMRRIRRVAAWESRGAFLLFLLIGLGLALAWREFLLAIPVWVHKLYPLFLEAGGLLQGLSRLPAARWGMMVLIGLAGLSSYTPSGFDEARPVLDILGRWGKPGGDC